MGDEYVVLVDDDDNPVGQALKSDVHTADTPLHRAFSVFLFNTKGDLLIQQRAHSKKTWPGVWSNSCCGHPGPDEATKAAAERRLEQELNMTDVPLHLVLPHFRYRVELDGIVENELCPVFVGFTDQEPKLNPDEVAATKWAPWKEFVAASKQSNPPYSPWSMLQVVELNQSQQFQDLFRANTSQQD